ncbi:MAG: YciI family protein [Candidatus Riflebacteria bacterium]|nr:YciI family protein [Candidatus Riflebacteria bacterium]
MKIFAVSKPVTGATPEKIMAMAKEEVSAGWKLYANGKFREMYFRKDGMGAIIVLECADEAEAKGLLAALPLVKAGLAEYDIYPALPFTHFELLFAK